MTEKKYFIREHLHREVFHGGIGNVDAERILLEHGYKAISFPFIFDFSLKAKIARLRYLILIFLSLPAGAVVVFQFPLYARMHKLLLRLLAFRKSIRIICFIADINGLKDGDAALLQQEIKELERYRYFIVHNKAMQQWLEQAVGKKHTAMIEFFDFLVTQPSVNRSKSNTVVFAGNLEKSGFLRQLHQWEKSCPGVQLLLYGPGYEAGVMDHQNVLYKGCMEPALLPARLEGAFGLVWDGESVTSCAGSLGHYMQYISHHKLSLYIVSGLPVITSHDCGSAEIIRHYRIGFTVGSLLEIEDKIAALPEEEYLQMVANTRRLAPRIAGGQSLPAALETLTGHRQP